MLKENTSINSPETLLLVGGKGTRLAAITGGHLSKGRVPINHEETVTGIDYISDVLTSLGVHDVHLLARHNANQYEDIAIERGYHVIFQQGETGTSGAVEEAIKMNGFKKQYLVISVDTLLSKNDLKRLLVSHKPGSITWGVSENRFSSMESYYGLVVDNNTNAILGDTKLPWWKNWDLSDTSLYVKGAVQVIDPAIYMHSVEILKRLCKKDYPIDLYWDVFPLLEEENRRRIVRGEESILQAIIFDDPLVDYGTPERLMLTRDLFPNIIKHNEATTISNF